MLKYEDSVKRSSAHSSINGQTVALFASDVTESGGAQYSMNVVEIELYKLNIEIVTQDFQKFCYASLDGIVK